MQPFDLSHAAVPDGKCTVQGTFYSAVRISIVLFTLKTNRDVLHLFVLRVCLHEMLQADWSMRGPVFHLET